MKKKIKKPGKPVKAGRILKHPDTSAAHAPLSLLSLANNTIVHIACLVFLILIIYANTLDAPFQWDDNEYIVNNPIIKNLHYFASPSDAKGFAYYSSLVSRYVGYLTFALNYRINGLSVTGYHIVNIAIHVTNSILVYFLVLLTFRTPFFSKTVNSEEVNSEWIKTEKAKLKDVPFSLFTIHDSRSLIAFFSSLLFAAHPLQTEAVTYVFQRFASLAAMFYLLSIVLYIKARLKIGGASAFVWFFLSLFFAVCAMKTKENAFTLPFMITLYEFCFFTGTSPRVSASSRLRYLAPILLTLCIIPVTLMSMGTAASGITRFNPDSYGATVFSRNEYLFTQFRIIVTYLRLLFLPVNQNIDYDYPVFQSFLDPRVILSFVFLSALFGLGVYMIIGNRQWAIGNGIKAKGKDDDSRFTSYDSRPLRLIGFGILWFFIALSVESSIIPISTIIDEYRVYLPSAGVIICVVTGAFLLQRFLLSRFAMRCSRLLLVMFAIALGVLSIAAHERNAVWGDGIRLWEDAALKSPARARVHLCLGNIYQGREMFDKAAEQYLIAITLKPDFIEAHNNLGAVYQFLKMPDKAMEQFLIAIKLKPDFAEAQLNLGIIYQALNMPEKAIGQYMAAIKLRPDLAEAHNHLGFVYLKMGQIENARRELTTGLNVKPDDQRARQLLEEVSH